MREIKFRAWDTTTLDMHYDDGETSNHYKRILPANEDTWFYNVGNVEPHNGYVEMTQFTFYRGSVMQYTGLKDKNGKEIYEGDVVKSMYGNFEIKWDEEYGGFGFNELGKYGTLLTTFEMEHEEHTGLLVSECEVIGNIYENPELIK